MQDVPLTRELVLIGGGHAHALVLRRWGMDPLPGARLTLIDPGPVAPYTGMLPGFVAGHYRREEIDIDLVRLARFAGARLIPARVTSIDRDRRRISTDTGRTISYDVASVDVGITSAMDDLPGFAAHAVAAKPLHRLAERWTAFLEGTGPARITMIGGGVGGVELAMAMAHALRARGRDADLRVLDRGAILGDLPDRARRALLARLDVMRIDTVPDVGVARIEADGVVLEDGRRLASDLTVGAAGARAWPWLAETGLAVTHGFLDVDATLATSDPRIFSAGDCAHLTFAPRPKAGVYAVRAAPILAHNLRAALAGGRMRRFRPQRDYLKIVSLGGREALATKWGGAIGGAWVWRWKDRIDRRFMARLADLPAMDATLPRRHALGQDDGAGPMCGGCGAKVGGPILARALAALPDLGRDDVTMLPGDDAALLTQGTEAQVITTDHLRAFTADPWLLTRITALHALGDVWAMGARPQAALMSVILPRMSEALQEAWLAEVLDAAAGVFGPEGAQIVGGHTTMGTELTVGFTVTGLVSRPITRGGGREGDALILSRPLGSGTILAAEMAMAAPGPVVAAALRVMATAQGDAARRLASAHAMTDVTGFGLAGHLLGLCTASEVGAELWPDRVPAYEGAVDLARAGIRSTIYPANRAAVAPLEAEDDDPRIALLFDPQTAGGFLAAVDPGEAREIVADLRGMGHDAARIGVLTAGPPRLRLRRDVSR